jgi:hypothetical protein
MSLKIKPFNLRDLRTTLIECSKNDATLAAQSHYLGSYLSKLGASCFIIEEDYTDAGYLVDYAKYYALCHSDYQRKTTRLHFFDTGIAPDTLARVILGESTEAEIRAAQDSYLGFTVIKPLPLTLIGRTCLAHYESSKNSDGLMRHFPIKRRYSVSCYGLPLNIDTVAFQEQDQEVAACSTAAIWYTLHSCPKRITESAIPAPYEITARALSHVAFAEKEIAPGSPHRYFPAVGLTLPQIVEYLRRRNYDCVVYGTHSYSIPHGSKHLTNEIVQAFLPAKVPLLLVGWLFEGRTEDSCKYLGVHAITALGYATDAGDNRFLPEMRKWSLERIKNVYAHDDGLGPFAKYQWKTKKRSAVPNPNGDAKKENATEASDRATDIDILVNTSELDGKSVTRLFAPIYAAVPLNSKVRLDFAEIRAFVDQVCEVIHRQINTPNLGLSPEQKDALLCGEWDIGLVEVNELKQEVSRTESLRHEKSTMLLTPLPKYMWRLQFSIFHPVKELQPDWEVLFDATDLSQGIGLLGNMQHKDSDESSNNPIFGQMRRLFISIICNAQCPSEIKAKQAAKAWEAMLKNYL